MANFYAVDAASAGGGGGITTGNLTDVGTDGIVITNGTGAVVGSGTQIAQHVADSSHSGYLASADWITFNAKQSSGNYITGLTGDVTATGPGSVAATISNSAVTNAKIANATIDLTTKVTGVLPTTNGGTGQNSTATFPTSGAVVTETSADQGANRLQNKDVDANTFAVVNTSDTTKKMLFDASGTTSTHTTISGNQSANRVLTLPDITDTLISRTSVDTGSGRLQNKQLDTNISFVDAGDTSKALQFATSANTTGKSLTVHSAVTVNRNINFPDADTTLVGTDSSQTLTNKVISSTNNTLTTASATVKGISTTYVPVVNSNYNSVNSANYIILDADGFLTIAFVTGNTPRTATLPVVANNVGRLLYIKKTDTGSGTVTIDGNGTNIDGSSTKTLTNQYACMGLTTDGSNWRVVSLYLT